MTHPDDACFPLCMDESSEQLVGEVDALIASAPAGADRGRRYVLNGVAEIFLEVEPLGGRRHLEIIERRTVSNGLRSSQHARRTLSPRDQGAGHGQGNTHNIASLYEAFPPQEARRLAQRLEIDYTLKHGSWLNVAEIAFSVLESNA